MIDAPPDRLQELCASLVELAERTEALEYLGEAPRADGSCVIRLTSPRGAISVLEVSPAGVTVTTRSNGVHAEAGESRIVDRLGVDLTTRYAWDHAACNSAEELADLLVKHMRRRVKEADPDPKIVEE